MAYYNSYNNEIRFRSGASNDNWGLFGTTDQLTNAYYDGGNTTRYNSQVIACDGDMANYNNGGENVAAKPLGDAGEFVSIDVIKGASQTTDIVVLVWYDGSDLYYTYNTTPLSYAWRDNNNVTNVYRGLNRRYWADATKIFTGAGEYCQVKVDGANHIHIAAFDPKNGDVMYAYLPGYNQTTNVQTYTVDSAGNTGSHLMMDVAIVNNNPVPYISYAAANKPKLAYLVNPDRGDGALQDMFTGNWEVTYIPTSSTVIDMDAKKLMNIDSRVNVGVWKNDNGTIKNSQAATGKDSANNDRTNTATANSGTCWGNGTANPVVGYQYAYDDANDRIETAQME